MNPACRNFQIIELYEFLKNSIGQPPAQCKNQLNHSPFENLQHRKFLTFLCKHSNFNHSYYHKIPPKIQFEFPLFNFTSTQCLVLFCISVQLLIYSPNICLIHVNSCNLNHLNPKMLWILVKPVCSPIQRVPRVLLQGSTFRESFIIKISSYIKNSVDQLSYNF